MEILNGACAKCLNYHHGDCVAVDAETLHKLYADISFTNAFEDTSKQNNNLMGSYMGMPVYLKRKIYEKSLLHSQ
jgi:hypothetical protein